MIVDRNVLIRLKDGTRLASDLYRPATGVRSPALISFYPYRKDDLVGAVWEYSRRYFTARGYATLLVDFRGTGGSDGVCPATFDTPKEGADGAEVVEWAAAQPWCDGRVGVWGMSYGGITSLAIAAQRPRHLRAIAPIYGCDDLQRDFVAPGGCRNCLGTYGWVARMVALDLAPPSFLDADRRWESTWSRRLDRLRRGDIGPLAWQRNANDNAYWREKAIPVERIDVAALMVGGWRDIYPQAVPDVYRRLGGPKKLLMGPWVHTLPDSSAFVPFDLTYEICRFFDRWLKGENNGIMEEPPVTIYVQGRNRWKHERNWPIPGTEVVAWHLHGGGRLTTTPPQSESDVGKAGYAADPTVGTAAGLWDPLGTGLGYPLDQADDDLRSITYTSDPLDDDLEIGGSPEATLCVAVEDGDELQLVAKLNDVSPEGGSSLITTGWLAVAPAKSYKPDSAMIPHAWTEHRIEMWATSYVVHRGHRLRLAIACGDFPRIWPLHINPAIRFDLARSVVQVPTVPATRAQNEGWEPRAPATDVQRAPWMPTQQVEDVPSWSIERHADGGEVAVNVRAPRSLRLPTGGDFRLQQTLRATVHIQAPQEAALESEVAIRMRLMSGAIAEVNTRAKFTRDTTRMEGDVSIDDRRVFAQEWRER